MRLWAIQIDGHNGEPATIAIATSPESAGRLQSGAYGGQCSPLPTVLEFDSDTYSDDL